MWNRYLTSKCSYECYCRRKRIPTFLLILSYAVSSGSIFSYAHDSLNRLVRHDIDARINRENIDVTIELTFYADHAVSLRAAFDADGDGSIASREIEGYFATLQPPYLNAISLAWNNLQLELIELYPPKVDLMEIETSGSDPCSIRMSCFARTPASLALGDRLTLREGLWPEFPALHTLKLIGEDGFEFSRVPRSETDVTPGESSNPLENPPMEDFVLLCTKAARLIPRTVDAENRFWSWEHYTFIGIVTATGVGFCFVFKKRSRN